MKIYAIAIISLTLLSSVFMHTATIYNGGPLFSPTDGTRITWTSKRGTDKRCQIFVADFIMPEILTQS